MEKFVGSYFELALHDYTQYPTCLDPSCIRTTKKFTDVGTGEQQIHESFSLECFGSEPYVVPYFFNTTDINGHLKGFLTDPPVWWKLVKFATEYPNTIIDFKESEDGG